MILFFVIIIVISIRMIENHPNSETNELRVSYEFSSLECLYYTSEDAVLQSPVILRCD